MPLAMTSSKAIKRSKLVQKIKETG